TEDDEVARRAELAGRQRLAAAALEGSTVDLVADQRPVGIVAEDGALGETGAGEDPVAGMLHGIALGVALAVRPAAAEGGSDADQAGFGIRLGPAVAHPAIGVLGRRDHLGAGDRSVVVGEMDAVVGGVAGEEGDVAAAADMGGDSVAHRRAP